MKELSKAYNPNETETRIYKMWEKSGYFNPDNLPGERSEPFSIVLPPPNVTGALHVGHSLMLVIQDILIRFRRMQGRKTLWLPGTDHAAIATQSKFEKELYKKEKKSRHDFTREEFFSMVNEFALQNQGQIMEQFKQMGASLDWSRLAFTLDEKRELAVRTAFKKMYDLGLIYRADRVINWDPKGQTTVSDDEVVYEEIEGTLYTFRYAPDFPIAIATTRPETKLGDTAVAVHPGDERYQEFVGKEYDINFIGGEKLKVKIIADETVDPEFGTGAVGVTPAHSMADWEIAQRHDLPSKQVINEYAKMTVGGQDLEGKKTSEAREVVVQWLKDKGLLVQEEKIKQNLSRAERTNGIIEPLPKLQWFVNVNKKFKLADSAGVSRIEGIDENEEVSLKQLMQAVVENGQIKIMPERFDKTYRHWIDNLRDWCISRQIIYGHRIPVWYCAREGIKCADIFVSINEPKECPGCGGNVKQDSDTLDTWFSSGLWTFSTLGWPEETNDLKLYHPTDVMETGYDIIFFWVARMILMSTLLLGEIPFVHVYLHGLVRDKDRQKMSKSKGNVVDPLGITEAYGTDALRFAMIFSTAPGQDVPLAEDKVKGMKHFANKLWNIARFIQMNLEDANKFQIPNSKPEPKTEADKDILKKLDETVKEVTRDLENFMLHEAAQAIYHFTWHEFADVYIEASKGQLLNAENSEPDADAAELSKNTQAILYYSLFTILKLLHPFMPFVTEEIYQQLFAKNEKDLLMVQSWPR